MQVMINLRTNPFSEGIQNVELFIHPYSTDFYDFEGNIRIFLLLSSGALIPFQIQYYVVHKSPSFRKINLFKSNTDGDELLHFHHVFGEVFS